MDGLTTAGISTSVVAVLVIGYKILQMIRGHRLISDCCGRMLEVGVDVRDMPPSPNSLERQSRQPLVPKKKVGFLESLSEYSPVVRKHPKGKGILLYSQTHPPSQVEEADISPVSSAPTSSDTTVSENSPTLQNDGGVSSLRILTSRALVA